MAAACSLIENKDHSCANPENSDSGGPGLEVIKLEYSLKLKIKHIDWLLADTCPQAANHCALFWKKKSSTYFIRGRSELPREATGPEGFNFFSWRVRASISYETFSHLGFWTPVHHTGSTHAIHKESYIIEPCHVISNFVAFWQV